jgi:PAS domain S-box-containing protein
LETIEELKKQIKVLEQYKNIVDNSSIVSKSDKFGNITFVNDKFCEISGYTKEELLGKPHNIVRSPDTPKYVFEDLWRTIKEEKKEWRGQIKNVKKDGSNYYVDAQISPILDDNNDIIEYIGIRYDISELINPKKLLQDNIKIMDNPFLVILKLEKYSTYENLYDEDTIYNIEKVFENTITDYLPSNCRFDKYFNLGNGEFALLKDVKDNDMNATQKELRLKEFQQNVKKAVIDVNGYEIDLSIILSFTTNKEDIYENAKHGLIKAQDTLKDIIFANDLTKIAKQTAIKHSQTIRMIQTAIQEEKIVSYFQPIINNETKQIEKYESLVRLIDEENKVISPYFFLEIAKIVRYYGRITNIVIDNYFAALKKTNKDISLNLSALDIEDLDIRNKLIDLVLENMQYANRIVFELLEDEIVKDFQVVKDFISLVKVYGVKIAIDDFGAGVSNFERLLDYQPDILKIDACLIKNIETDQYSRDVVETIQSFAKKQGIKTVAEFVSNEYILKIVTDIGINYSQGFYLGKPEPLEDIKKY